MLSCVSGQVLLSYYLRLDQYSRYVLVEQVTLFFALNLVKRYSQVSYRYSKVCVVHNSLTKDSVLDLQHHRLSSPLIFDCLDLEVHYLLTELVCWVLIEITSS